MNFAPFYRFKAWGLLILAFILCAPLFAQTYTANFSDARWTTTAGPFACSLAHNIPGFGSARFVRNAGSGEFFELKGNKQVFPSGAVKIESVPPLWRDDVSPAALGQVQVGAQQVRLTAAQATAVGTSLGQGTNVAFSSAQVGASGNSLRVVLEARNFAPAYSKYQRCIAQLIPYTFDQLSRTLINYSNGAEELSPGAKAQLDKIVRYTKADPRVLGIIVDAHSEKLATVEEGEIAAQRQAELVTNYLIEKGLGLDKITTRWHGDKFPIANNQNKSGQAKNRRVTIRLENEATRKEMEKKIAAIKEAEQKAAEAQFAATKAAETSSQQQSSGVKPELPIDLQQLEQMVEQQDLGSGKQPTPKPAQ
ncbi:MAG TPA: OmpA family protein [Cellvibrio sp.]|nr:OmpA family protein [Cellvibrio sp.]